MRCNTNSVLRGDKMDISLPCSATQARAHQSSNHTEMPSIPSKLIFQKFHFYSFPQTHLFFIKKTSYIVYRVLSVLVSINVQTKSDINLGSQGMVITNQGVAIQPCFHASKTYAIYKTGHWVVFIKTRTETCSKGWD